MPVEFLLQSPPSLTPAADAASTNAPKMHYESIYSPQSLPIAPIFKQQPFKPSEGQIGGSHYKQYPIQPIEYTVANNLSYLAGNVVKYVTRYKDKGGAEDIKKAIHYLEMILEFEYNGKP